MDQYNIAIALPFSEEEIDKSMYTSSILSRCMAEGIVTAEKFQAIILELNAVFSEIADQYTGRESSSLCNEKAEQLYSSVLYWADIDLLSLGSLTEAVRRLLTVPMTAILHSGLERINQLHNENRTLFAQVHANRINAENDEYQYVCTKAYQHYLQRYSSRFDAKNIHTALDYPLLSSDYEPEESQGTLYMHRYYSRLSMENEFCRMFDAEKLEKLLKKAASVNRDVLYSIAAVVCAQYFANLMLGREELLLSLSAKDIEDVTAKCALFTEEMLTNDLQKAFASQRSAFPSDACYAYIAHYIPHFIHTACFFAGTQAGLKKQLYVLR